MSENKWAEKLAERVELGQRTEFIRFVTTGEASNEFLSHLDSCPVCKNAVEEAFQITSKQFEDLGRVLARDRNKKLS